MLLLIFVVVSITFLKSLISQFELKVIRFDIYFNNILKKLNQMANFFLCYVAVFISVMVGCIKSCSTTSIPKGSLNISEH